MIHLVQLTAAVLSMSAGAAAEAAGRAASEADVAKLRKEVQDQRQLLVAILRAEQRRNEMLLKFLLLNEPLPSSDSDALPATSGALDLAPPPMEPLGDDAAKPRRTGPATATVKGTVALAGHAPGEAYVYVENVTAAPVSTSLVIKQENKQFSPRLAVVQRGTRLVFSNADSIFHNVFSVSPGYSFDLGAQRAGDSAKTVVATTPGVVEIFCNMHSRMSSTVLVVPNSLYAKVEHDGSFVLHNVPVGARKIVAWAPGAKAATNEVDLRGAGAEVRFALESSPQSAHANKFGQPYGSYDD